MIKGRELVVLADDGGKPTGTAPKATVHTTDTPLHLAFSCYLIGGAGEVLLTRRALGKRTWPGVWTNSMCGHPGPGEDTVGALLRRGTQELGLKPEDLTDVTCVLPDFRYRAVDSSGIVEFEICPVYTARLAPGATVAPLPDEVDQMAWSTPSRLVDAVRCAPFAFSPWMGEQLAHAELRAALGLS
ncbi:isopentenyl-diphosphate Delta-isomerase [Corynebacterium pygosceleis]|uniref:isopentenyl-diphosphate Delta-isomerase n=1 Tax=Corynebacterium pygosceleis TaxID=2800406 RepID=UPI001905B14E|nr:isopentenyl-diphosphate Delta-isomerase [Corynebacterium pygosceleis]MCL0120704.1 isopentenyl-diphosphate Delta-isomerase [Corynebacterium pygosceleis]